MNRKEALTRGHGLRDGRPRGLFMEQGGGGLSRLSLRQIPLKKGEGRTRSVVVKLGWERVHLNLNEESSGPREPSQKKT